MFSCAYCDHVCVFDVYMCVCIYMYLSVCAWVVVCRCVSTCFPVCGGGIYIWCIYIYWVDVCAFDVYMCLCIHAFICVCLGVGCMYCVLVCGYMLLCMCVFGCACFVTTQPVQLYTCSSIQKPVSEPASGLWSFQSWEIESLFQLQDKETLLSNAQRGMFWLDEANYGGKNFSPSSSDQKPNKTNSKAVSKNKNKTL